MKARQLPFFLCLVLVIGMGCGGDEVQDMPDVGAVKGKVELDGAPLAGASILFHPTEGGRSSSGTSDDAGNYTLMYNSNTPGAKVGEHEVTISTFREAADNEAGELVPGREEEVPAKYATTEVLKVNVKAGENAIDLKLTP